MAKYTFKRIEKKYLVDRNTYLAFISAIRPYVVKDEYGKYTTSSLYFDTADYSSIRTSLEKPVYKEKLRLRSYGIPKEDDLVFLEIKKKYKHVGYKRRIELPYKEAKAYITQGIRPTKDSQIFHEIDYLIQSQNLKPSLYLTYEREAYAGIAEPDLRITIDHSIRSRSHNLTLASDKECHELLKHGQYLIELKACGAYPFWLVKILEEFNIYPHSFSKYGQIYKFDLASKGA
jgi:hypothetical protein